MIMSWADVIKGLIVGFVFGALLMYLIAANILPLGLSVCGAA